MNIFVQSPESDHGEVYRLHSFIDENQEKLGNDSTYELETIYKTLDGQIKDAREMLEKIEDMKDIDDIKELVEHVLLHHLW